MSWAFRTMIIPADTVQTAQNIAAGLSPAGVDMWLTPLSSNGQDPPTYYVSTGMIGPEFAALMPEQTWELQEEVWVLTASTPGNAAAIYDLCQAAELEITLEEIQTVFASADVTQQEPFAAFARLGVSIVNSEMV